YRVIPYVGWLVKQKKGWEPLEGHHPTNRGTGNQPKRGSHPTKQSPAVSYSPTTSRLQYHRRCESSLPGPDGARPLPHGKTPRNTAPKPTTTQAATGQPTHTSPPPGGPHTPAPLPAAR